VYQFAGFFAKPSIDPPKTLPSGAVWRSISVPFDGVGVRIPALLGESPEPSEVHRLLEQLGLDVGSDWLYLTYDCWGGQVDYVYGFGMRGGQAFGPQVADDSQAQAVYIDLMGEFGVLPADAIQFPAFVRGFWGES
jgi:hypothetical protein